MLCRLHIENVAIIDKLDIEFENGFTVLTGETGAGKSIIIDSINFVVGDRASRELVKTGAQKALVIAEFCNINQLAQKALQELSIDLDGDNLFLQREMTADGRSSCRINGVPMPLASLKTLGALLVNIHGQHENQALLQKESHRYYLDSYAGIADLLEEYKAIYDEVAQINSEIDALTMDEQEKARKIELLQYQIDEITAANLAVGEEDELLRQRTMLQNSEKIRESMETAYQSLYNSAAGVSACSLISDASSALSSVANLLPELDKIASKLDEIYYLIEDCVSEISAMKESFDDDSLGSINDVEARLGEIYRLKRKYGKTEADILAYCESCKSQLENIQLSSERISLLEKKLQSMQQQLHDKAALISFKRKEAALQLSKLITSELAFLDMGKAVFEVKVEIQTDGEGNPLFTATGFDSIEFLISTNPGEPLKPIAKIASGGELSRVMLAMKNVLSGADFIDTMIFDEIDSGVSGRAAQKIALKLKQVSLGRQIFCVTHLPQIAASADNHLYIEKVSLDGKVKTAVTALDFDRRKREIARIIAGDNITDAALKSAEEMLLQSKN